MKKFALLKLFPTGNFASGNQVINELDYSICKEEAVQYFRENHPELNLNDNGYAKHGDVSYCIAEYYQP